MKFWLYNIGQIFRVAFGFWGLFGLVIGSISVFNLILKVFDLGAAVVFIDILSTYRWLFHRVFLEFFWNAFDIVLPPWLNDIVVVWLSASAISTRTLVAARRHAKVAIRDVRPLILGNVEKALFKFPNWAFNVIAVAISLIGWPLTWIRYLHGSRKFSFPIPGFRPDLSKAQPFELGIEYSCRASLQNEQQITYRTLWVFQLATILALITLLVITNAGLPQPVK